MVQRPIALVPRPARHPGPPPAPRRSGSAFGPGLLLWGLPAALLAGLLVLAPSPGTAETRIYEARHRPAAELLPLAETALGDRGRAAPGPGGRRIVMVGEAGALAEVAALLEELDRPLRSVVLRYRSEGTEALAARGLVVEWHAGHGDLRVGRVRDSGAGAPHGARASAAPAHSPRGSVHPPGSRSPVGRGAAGDAHVRIHAEATEGEEREDLAGTLRVVEGRSARIATGSAVPVAVGTHHDPHAGVHESTAWVAAESGFEATPRILGDGRVQLALRPFAGRVEAGGRVAHTDAATTVVVVPGETVVVGSLARHVQSSRRDLLAGGASAERRSERVLLISVDVE